MSDASETQNDQVRLPPRIIWEPDGKEMILIPDCAFVMGQDGGPANEGPQHIVTVEGYYIDRYQVTQAEYQNFVQETGHTVPCYELEWTDREYNWDPETATPPADKIDHPVTTASAVHRSRALRAPIPPRWAISFAPTWHTRPHLPN